MHGGVSDRNELYIAPTILDHVDWGDQVMEGEIFGPILPVLSYQRSEFQCDVIDAVNAGEKPLALYIFASPAYRSVAWVTPAWERTMGATASTRSRTRSQCCPTLPDKRCRWSTRPKVTAIRHASSSDC